MTAHKHFKQLVRARMRSTGESYSSARRVLLARQPAGPRSAPRETSDSRHFPGVIPATSALRVLLASAGVTDPRTDRPLTEALLFALAGGIGVGVCSFVYEKEDFASFFLAGRHAWHDDHHYLVAALQRLRKRPRVQETASAKAAERALRAALELGSPCAAFVDMAMLPHRCMPTEFQGGGYHVIVIYSMDESRGLCRIGDLTDEPIELPLADLAVARARIRKFRHRLIDLPPEPRRAAALSAETLAGAVRAGLAACHAGLTGVPARGYPNMFNLDALRLWADRLDGSKDPSAWSRAYPRGHRLWAALTGVYDYIENYGTGGGLCRPIFATALAEAAALLNEPRLAALGRRYANIGGEWSALASAALPADVPLFRAAREQFARRSELLASGATSRDDAARPAVADVWDRLAALRDEARRAFPLSPADCDALRRRLQRRVRALHRAELAAHDELGRILA